jgi:hypothetical protein
MLSSPVDYPPPFITIFVNRNHEPWFSVDVDAYATVSSLKDIISKKTGMYPSQQRLVFRGVVLANEMSLSYYNITNGSRIYFVPVAQQSAPRAQTCNLLHNLWPLLDQLSPGASCPCSDLRSRIQAIIEDPVIESLARTDSAVKDAVGGAWKVTAAAARPTAGKMRGVLSRAHDLLLDQFDNSADGVRILRSVVEEVLAEESARAPPSEPTRIRPACRICERPLPNPWPGTRREGPLYASGLRLSLGPADAGAMAEFAREVEMLREMGFTDEGRMLHALSEAKGNVHFAAQLLERGVC